MIGTVTSYLSDKNYGFIKGEDGKDYFFHDSYLDYFKKEKVYDNNNSKCNIFVSSNYFRTCRSCTFFSEKKC